MKLFIDGKTGTTGLRILERIQNRKDIKLISLSEEERKDAKRRRWALNHCDIAMLCLPDDAAREAICLIENPAVKVIDASTAHRTREGWSYGFPELSPTFRQNIQNGSRIAVPGCYASGFVALIYPLVEAGILDPSVRLTCHAVSGYSGGGKKMIGEYEASQRSPLLDAPRQYALTQGHKHLPEMKYITRLNTTPIFCPWVSDYYSGMVVTVPLFREDAAGGDTDAIRRVYQTHYNGPVVFYQEAFSEEGLLSACALSGLDRMEISVEGNADRILLLARFDNLGKGASGAAVQCLNLMTGQKETEGLSL